MPNAPNKGIFKTKKGLFINYGLGLGGSVMQIRGWGKQKFWDSAWVEPKFFMLRGMIIFALFMQGWEPR